jgi:hypothetical protein
MTRCPYRWLIAATLLLVPPGLSTFALAAAVAAAAAAAAKPPAQPALIVEGFSSTPYGRIPAGWQDLFAIRPTPGWIVDGNSLLRATLKGRTGLIARDGEVTDGTISADFKKTEDAAVSVGVAGRIVDRDNSISPASPATTVSKSSR